MQRTRVHGVPATAVSGEKELEHIHVLCSTVPCGIRSGSSNRAIRVLLIAICTPVLFLFHLYTHPKC